MSFTPLATKLHRPPPTSTLVARPRLTQHLDQGLQKGHPLLLVVAPAGYGKTTLISTWLGEAGIPSTWLQLDESDNEPIRFFSYVTAALGKIDARLGQSLAGPLRNLSRSAEELVTPLINDLAEVGQAVLLVLDDYHLISDALIQEAMTRLVERAPANLHLVVLTRVDPPFSLPRLRVRGRMTEIRGDALRFTPSEMEAFLNFVHGLALPASQIAALESRTEGWPAGVQLAALSLQECDAESAARFIQAFSGSHHYIIDYLGDEVLRRQSEELQSFLLQTSVLDRLCGPLCDAVLGGAQGSGEILAELERKNLFLVPLDDQRQWYRYHHLLSDLLFQRLKQAQPELVRTLYLRAALWLEENEQVESAVGYALKAEDYARAARLIDQVKFRLWDRGDIPLLIGWLKTMPAELLRAQPELALTYAVSLTLAGYFSAAEEWIRLAETYFAQAAESDEYAARRLHRIPLYRSIHARYREDFEAAIALGQKGLDATPRTMIRDRAAALLFVGHAHFYAGHTDEAERTLSEAMQCSLSSAHHSAYVNACHHLAQLRMLQGRLGQARLLYEQAGRVLRERDPTVLAGAEEANLGDLYREWNALETAAPRIQKGIKLAEASDHISFLTDAYLAGVRLALAQRDWEAARSTLQRAERVVRRCATNREMETLRAWEARLHLAQGNLTDARLWADRQETDLAGPFHPQLEANLLTLARVWLADGKPRDAARLLERLRTGSEMSGRYGRALEAEMLQACADQEAGREAEAFRRFGRVLERARPEGYVRLFIDEGEPMVRLLKQAVGRGISPGYSSKLLAAAESERRLEQVSRAGAGAMTPLIEPLSQREIEVLHLVAAGLQNGEIADRLIISVRTVKKHVQNIHGKLGVTNRTAATARARELNLL